MSRTFGAMPRFAAFSWWLGVVVSAGLVLLGALDTEAPRLPPETPFDCTGSGHAPQWRCLAEASRLVPAGSTFTVRGPDPGIEMSLYMMAVGLLPDSTAIPTTYYGRPVAASAGARFVVTCGSKPEPADDPLCTLEVEGGFVTDRGPSQP
jgi:hypothetical protein